MNTLIRREPVSFPTFDRLFGQLLGDPFFAEMRPAVAAIEEGTLPIDLSEDEKSIFVRASLPGFKKDEIEVEVHDGVVSIKAARSEEKETTDEKFYRRERRFGSVSRRVALPTVVDEQKVAAELKDGVLTLTLPKTKPDSPRKININ
ncbi:MAG: Hsp20/alpha crystallin family protein [Phycisphaerales bacterium]|jgi:HSP20 family protein|nr:Hsp20/alpha crystallin family protein [Phycisphaerales bacterium]